jgi:hypothetical protein
MQAIETKFLEPTNHNGARIRVRAQAGAMTVPWDYDLNPEENHIEAAKAFALKWGWLGQWSGGARADDRGYVFVHVGRGVALSVVGEPPQASQRTRDQVSNFKGGTMDEKALTLTIAEWETVLGAMQAGADQYRSDALQLRDDGAVHTAQLYHEQADEVEHLATELARCLGH